MAQEETDYVFIKNLAGLEDMAFGVGTNQEVRDGEIVAITEINSLHIPHKMPDGTISTVGAVLNDLLSAGVTP